MVGEGVGGRSRSEEKSKSGTFPPRLEIPQERRDSHFFHRPGGYYEDDYSSSKPGRLRETCSEGKVTLAAELISMQRRFLLSTTVVLAG